MFLDLQKLKDLRILCIGDIMLDHFTYGQVSRISPEAPIPILSTKETLSMLGGVGNVVSNLKSLEITVDVVSVIGQDETGEEIIKLATAKNGHAKGLITDPTRRSTLKKRFIAGNQQLLRVDEETEQDINPEITKQALEYLGQNLAQFNAVIVSDYGKGMITKALLAPLIQNCKQLKIPVFVDPKGRDYSKYHGADFVTPNLKELKEVSGHAVDTDENVIAAAQLLLAAHDFGNISVTRSEKGILLVTKQGETASIRHQPKDIFDVSGAGDTVISVLASGIALGLTKEQAITLANLAGSLVVQKVGTATVTVEELKHALSAGELFKEDSKISPKETMLDRINRWKSKGYKIGFTNGCFDLIHPGHVSLLAFAKSHCDKLVVGLNSDQSIKRLKGPTRPVQNEHARSVVLASLEAVDLLTIFDEDTPYDLIKQIKPDVLIKGQDYTIETVVGHDIVQHYGGKVILAPLEDGHSTTNLTKIIAAHKGKALE